MIKRFLDIVFSIIIIVTLIPLYIFLILIILIKLGNPVFFYQVRSGLNGKEFTLIKFRSMTGYKDKKNNLLPDEKRLDNFGKFLRSYSLDELPSILNVLVGQMSLVGPRPLLTEYLPLYTKKQSRRLKVKPGITGWAQINGRNAISWEKKFDLDVWYVDNQSTWLDFEILFLTLKKVIKREGINSDGDKAMPVFKGLDK